MKEQRKYNSNSTDSYNRFGNGSSSSYNKISSDSSSENENLSPKQFLDKYSLPRIVNIAPEEPVANTNTETYNNPVSLLNGKLLIYRQYRGGKIEAKTFCKTKNNRLSGELRDSSSTETSVIVIPDTYDGWFSVVTERGQMKARLYTSIQRLVTAQVTAFLIIAPDLIGYIQNHGKSTDGIRHQYCKVTIKRGQVLKLLAVYQDIASQSARSKRLSWPLLGARQETTQYAQCLTSTKQFVYVPITTHGHFYAVSTANNSAEDNISKVYQIGKLLQVFPLPVRVCTVAPNKSQGSMLLENYHKENVMLACILDQNNHNGNRLNKFKFLEIDVNSKFYISRVHDEQRLFKSIGIQEALRNCHDNSDKWCQQLKVIHHIYPQKNLKENIAENSENSKPMKKLRKVSLGDKKTVKSSSFRYSTSYGSLEDVKPLYRNIIDRAFNNNRKNNNTRAPLYLNVSCKTSEENCSSLPVQKTSRNIYENESVQLKLPEKNSFTSSNTDNINEMTRRMTQNNPLERLEQLTKISNTDHLQHIRNVYNNSSYQTSETMTKLTTANANHQSTPQLVTIINYTDNNEICQSRLDKTEPSIIKTSLQNFSTVKNSKTHLHKTCVKIQIEGPYSNVADSLEMNLQSQDNIYTEIGDCYIPHYFKSNLSSSRYKSIQGGI